jgi:predicted cupin superfamily sugar epimerase
LTNRPSVSPALTLDALILMLGLQPHPEGGFYRETQRVPAADGQRSSGTAIYYLLGRGDRSHWHRVDAVEIWHFYAGAPLELSIAANGEAAVEIHVLGTDLSAGQRPQLIVPLGHWQSAVSTGEWTLVGCTVSPGFEFSGFEMAPPGWKPEA